MCFSMGEVLFLRFRQCSRVAKSTKKTKVHIIQKSPWCNIQSIQRHQDGSPQSLFWPIGIVMLTLVWTAYSSFWVAIGSPIKSPIRNLCHEQSSIGLSAPRTGVSLLRCNEDVIVSVNDKIYVLGGVQSSRCWDSDFCHGRD